MHQQITEPRRSARPLPPWVVAGPPHRVGPPSTDLPKRRVRRPSVGFLAAVSAVAALAVVVLALPGGPDGPARISIVVFLVAIALWLGNRVDDTYVALGAALVLVGFGVVGSDVLFGALGSETIWLLVAAFVVSAGVSATGLTARFAAGLITRAATVRQLAHLVTFALLATAFAVPSTSGRAALTLPIFTALAGAVADRQRVVKAFAILFPTVILLTAVATLIGAGAHLVTNEILAATTGEHIGFAHWLVLGLPLALVSAHLATELVLHLFTTADDRSARLSVTTADLAAHVSTPLTGRLRPCEIRALVVLAVIIACWIAEPWHGLHPALIALAGALAITSPQLGTTTMSHGLRTVPWGLLVFMAATATLGAALAGSGAADWLAGGVFGVIVDAPPAVVLVALVTISVAAHLGIASRTARSSVLIPLVIPVALSAGLNPVALAFASTAAAGFCHSLTSSAKPVAVFAEIDGTTAYTSADLLRLSRVLAPLTVLLVVACALWLWPHLGLPLS